MRTTTWACMGSLFLAASLFGCGSGNNGNGNAGGASNSTGGGNSTGASTGTGATSSSTGGTNSSGGTNGTGATSSGGAGQTGTRLVDSAVFYQDISQATKDSESDTIMAALQASGWGDAGHRQTLGVDFSFVIGVADASVARRAFTQPTDALPDCDTAPIPVIPGGSVEGSNNYECSGDCHLLVYQGTRLYELYATNITGGQAVGGTFTGMCLVIWDLTKDYWKPAAPPNFSRGDHCNGADAGDQPIAPLLLTKAEIAAGAVNHAMRFTISNNRIRSGVYVHPATHIGGPTGGPTTLPYGARLRLRANYDLTSLPNDGARTVAKALQKYGMFLADGGNIYVSATTDAADAIGGSDLGALQPKDFEMVDGGPRINWSDYSCNRTPITN